MYVPLMKKIADMIHEIANTRPAIQPGVTNLYSIKCIICHSIIEKFKEYYYCHTCHHPMCDSCCRRHGYHGTYECKQNYTVVVNVDGVRLTKDHRIYPPHTLSRHDPFYTRMMACPEDPSDRMTRQSYPRAVDAVPPDMK